MKARPAAANVPKFRSNLRASIKPHSVSNERTNAARPDYDYEAKPRAMPRGEAVYYRNGAREGEGEGEGADELAGFVDAPIPCLPLCLEDLVWLT